MYSWCPTRIAPVLVCASTGFLAATVPDNLDCCKQKTASRSAGTHTQHSGSGRQHQTSSGCLETGCAVTLLESFQRQVQVLTLEAFAKRAEKLLQLLAELDRRLQLRLADAEHRSNTTRFGRASPGVKQGVPSLLTNA